MKEPLINAHTVSDNVIRHLNDKTGSSFSPETVKTSKLIEKRLKEGYTEADLIKAIDIKCSHWMGDADMEKYLRPSTLFGPKFSEYLGQKNQNEYYSYNPLKRFSTKELTEELKRRSGVVVVFSNVEDEIMFSTGGNEYKFEGPAMVLINQD